MSHLPLEQSQQKLRYIDSMVGQRYLISTHYLSDNNVGHNYLPLLLIRYNIAEKQRDVPVSLSRTLLIIATAFLLSTSGIASPLSPPRKVFFEISWQHLFRY